MTVPGGLNVGLWMRSYNGKSRFLPSNMEFTRLVSCLNNNSSCNMCVLLSRTRPWQCVLQSAQLSIKYQLSSAQNSTVAYLCHLTCHCQPIFNICNKQGKLLIANFSIVMTLRCFKQPTILTIFGNH